MKNAKYKYTINQICTGYAKSNNLSENTVNSQLKYLDVLLHIKKINTIGARYAEAWVDASTNETKIRVYNDNKYYSDENKAIIHAWLDEFKYGFISVFKLNDKEEGLYTLYDKYQKKEGGEKLTIWYKEFEKRMDELYIRINDPDLKELVHYLSKGFDTFNTTQLEERENDIYSIPIQFENLILSVDPTLRPGLRVKAEKDWSLWFEKIKAHYNMEEQPYARNRK